MNSDCREELGVDLSCRGYEGTESGPLCHLFLRVAVTVRVLGVFLIFVLRDSPVDGLNVDWACGALAQTIACIGR